MKVYLFWIVFLGLAVGSLGSADVQKSEDIDAGISCFSCKVVLQELETVCQRPEVEANVESWLDTNVCSLFPSNLQSECVSMVTEYGASLVNVLVALLPPDDVCNGIGLCSGSHLMPLHKPSKNANSTACQTCTFIGDTVLSLLTDQATETDLVDSIAKLCLMINNSQDKATCTNLISEYGTAIVDVLFRSVDPAVLCADIDIC